MWYQNCGIVPIIWKQWNTKAPWSFSISDSHLVFFPTGPFYRISPFLPYLHDDPPEECLASIAALHVVVDARCRVPADATRGSWRVRLGVTVLISIDNFIHEKYRATPSKNNTPGCCISNRQLKIPYREWRSSISPALSAIEWLLGRLAPIESTPAASRNDFIVRGEYTDENEHSCSVPTIWI